MTPTVGLAIASQDSIVLCKDIKPAATGLHDIPIRPTAFMQPGIVTILDARTISQGLGFTTSPPHPSAYGIEWVPDSTPSPSGEVRSRLNISFLRGLDVSTFNTLNSIIHQTKNLPSLRSFAVEKAEALLSILEALHRLHAQCRTPIPDDISGSIYSLIHAIAATISRNRST